MKQHLVAFGGAAQDFSAGLVTVPFIADGLIRASSNVLQLNQNWDANWAWIGGLNLTRVRLNSAQSRIRGFPNIHPIENAALPGDFPKIADMRLRPIKLYQGENVTLQATNGAAATTVGFMSLIDPQGQYVPTPPGARLVRFTCSIVAPAFGWSPGANVVLDDDLESGVYDVYGMSIFQATLLGARLVFNSQVEKPGCIAGQVATDRPSPVLIGGTGKWGEFESITPPFIEGFANAAATIACVGQLLLVKQR